MAATSFTDLRALMQKVDALTGKLDAAAPASPAPMVAQLVDGAVALVEQRITQRLTQFEQQLAEHRQQMASLAVEIRGSIPQMPDFGPLVSALQANAAAAAEPDEPDDREESPELDLSPLIAGLAEVVKGQREMCARMDKPVIREGVAELPSGQVKLRITETRAK